MSTSHAAHLRLAVPPRPLASHLSFPPTPAPTPSKNHSHRLNAYASASPAYAGLLLRLLYTHALFLLIPSVRALPVLTHVLPLPPLLAGLASLLLLPFALSCASHPLPALPHLLPPALLLSLSLLLHFLALRLLPSPGLLVLADSAGSLLARALRRPSRRGCISIAVAAVSLVSISPSPSILVLPIASGFLASIEHSVSVRHVARSHSARAATFAIAAAFLSGPAVVGMFFLGRDGDGDGDGFVDVSLTRLWWVLLNAAVFSMVLGRRQHYSTDSGRPSMDFAMTFVCTVVLELVYYPNLSLPGFLICGLLLWIAHRELAPPDYVELGSMDTSESVYESVMGPVRHILSERKSRKIAAFLLINTAYMVIEFAGGFMSNSLGLISDACHMLFDCAALAIGLYASYIARLPANGLYNYGRGRFEVLSGYVNAVFLVLVGALIVLESFERILEPREISTSSLLVVSIGGLLVNIIGLVFFHEEHHHAHGGTCSHSHSLSHSHSHHHGRADHHHHVHVHQGVNYEDQECCAHHGDASKSHHDHDHHHHHHINNENRHNNLMENSSVQTFSCKEKQNHDHDHGHEHRHRDHFDHHQQGRYLSHQECSKINSEQGLLEIPLGNIHSQCSEAHSCNEELCSPKTENHKDRSRNHHHIDHNMEGIFLHVLADTMGSVGVVVSTLLIKYKGWLIADPICSVFISIMIVCSVLPLLRNSAEILLQRVPRSHEKGLRIALDHVMKIKGVYAVDNVHVWNLTNTDIVGTFYLHVSTEADKSFIRERASQVFHEAGIQDLTIQIECVKR